MRHSMNRRTMISGLAAWGALSMIATEARAASRKTFFKRTGLPIGLQLYTLGPDVAKDISGTLAAVAALGYRDIELPSLYDLKAADVRAAADKVGVNISSIHLAAGFFARGGLSLNSPVGEIADTLHTLGIKRAALPIMLLPDNFKMGEGESFQVAVARGIAAGGADVWKRTAMLLNEKASALKSHGIRLGYHNHNLEFAAVGTTTGWDILMQETDKALVDLEIDIGWVAASGMDPVAFLQKHRGRVTQLHVKDITAANVANTALQMSPTEIGSGTLDWAKILPAARKAGVQHFYVEQEPPFAGTRMAAVTKSIGYLSKLVA